MDIRTLPEQERNLYNTLKQSYSLHFTSVKIGSAQIRLLKPSEIDELLERTDAQSGVVSFPYWSKLWEASTVMAHVLSAGPQNQNSRLLELGAGLGLCGIVASAAGFDVVMTDREQIPLDFQRVSAAANNEQIEHLQLDWHNPPALGRFNVIAGAEILANEELLDPILDICKNYLETGGTIYLAHDLRRKSLPMFLRKAEEFFTIGSKKQSIRTKDRVVDILINRLQPR